MKKPLSHFLLCLFVISVNGAYAQTVPEHVMSKEAYDETLLSLNTHVKYVTSLQGFREGGTPLFYLHPPGRRVWGTVLVFHGYGSNAAGSAVQAKKLFAKKFNVVSFNLAGFAQNPEFWISTVLRKTKGYDLVRQTLLKDPILAPIIAEFQRLGSDEKKTKESGLLKEPVVPRILASLRNALSTQDFTDARSAIELLKPGLTRSGIEKEIRNYFNSGHQVFESNPFEKLHLVKALPGPVHAMGFSFGGAAVVNLAARSKVISKAVMLAPFIGRITEREKEEYFYLRAVLGSVDLFSASFPIAGRVIEIPGRVITPSLVASNLLNRDAISNSMRDSTKTLCIIAEDDDIVDLTHTLEYCRSKLAAQTFVYPASLKLNHLLTPESGSKYSDAMLEQIANYFITGNVDNRRFLIRN